MSPHSCVDKLLDLQKCTQSVTSTSLCAVVVISCGCLSWTSNNMRTCLQCCLSTDMFSSRKSFGFPDFAITDETDDHVFTLCNRSKCCAQRLVFEIFSNDPQPQLVSRIIGNMARNDDSNCIFRLAFKFTLTCESSVVFAWFILLRSETPKGRCGKCAKLHIVAANNNNRDHATRLL